MSDDWADPVPAEKMRVGRDEVDSKLEAAWLVTLTAYGFDVWWHPGRIQLRDGGWWEPDGRVGDVLVEVKPWDGESVEREWKPRAAADEHELPVLILRPGLVPADWETETAGCVWESCDGETWIAVKYEGGGMEFVRLDRAAELPPVMGVYFSADEVLLDSSETKVGMTMKHWSDAR
jgi:hypothetical protein